MPSLPVTSSTPWAGHGNVLIHSVSGKRKKEAGGGGRRCLKEEGRRKRLAGKDLKAGPCPCASLPPSEEGRGKSSPKGFTAVLTTYTCNHCTKTHLPIPLYAEEGRRNYTHTLHSHICPRRCREEGGGKKNFYTTLEKLTTERTLKLTSI